MRKLFALTLVVFLAPSLLAAGWTKPYFAKTKPGSWASYRSTSTIGPPSTMTMTRLADHDGQVVIEVFSEYNDNVTPPSTQRIELAKGFDADRELIDYRQATVAMSYSVKGSAYTPMTAQALVNMKARPTYGAVAVFKATETVDGKACDHYTYTQKPDPEIETGDIWLNADVPFGQVKQTTTMKDASGKVVWTGETVLTGSTKVLPVTTTAAATPISPPDHQSGLRAGPLSKVDIAPGQRDNVLRWKFGRRASRSRLRSRPQFASSAFQRTGEPSGSAKLGLAGQPVPSSSIRLPPSGEACDSRQLRSYRRRQAHVPGPGRQGSVVSNMSAIAVGIC